MTTCRQAMLFLMFSILAMAAYPRLATGQKQARSAAAEEKLRQQIDNFIYVLSLMKLGCENPGVRIELVTKGLAGFPMEAWEQIRMTDSPPPTLPDTQFAILKFH